MLSTGYAHIDHLTGGVGGDTINIYDNKHFSNNFLRVALVGFV